MAYDLFDSGYKATIQRKYAGAGDLAYFPGYTLYVKNGNTVIYTAGTVYVANPSNSGSASYSLGNNNSLSISWDPNLYPYQAYINSTGDRTAKRATYISGTHISVTKGAFDIRHLPTTDASGNLIYKGGTNTYTVNSINGLATSSTLTFSSFEELKTILSNNLPVNGNRSIDYTIMVTAGSPPGPGPEPSDDHNCKLKITSISDFSPGNIDSNLNNVTWEKYGQVSTDFYGWFSSGNEAEGASVAQAPWTTGITTPAINDYIPLNEHLREPDPRQAFSRKREHDDNNSPVLNDYLWWNDDGQGKIFAYWKKLDWDSNASTYTDTGSIVTGGYVEFTSNNQSKILSPIWNNANNLTYKLKTKYNNELKEVIFPHIDNGEFKENEIKVFITSTSNPQGYLGKNYVLEYYKDNVNNPPLVGKNLSGVYEDYYLNNYTSDDEFSLKNKSNVFFRFYSGKDRNNNSIFDSTFNLYKNYEANQSYDTFIWGIERPVDVIYHESFAVFDKIKLLNYPVIYGNGPSNGEDKQFDFVASVVKEGTKFKTINYSERGLDNIYYKDSGDNSIGLIKNSQSSITQKLMISPQISFEIDQENSTNSINLLDKKVIIKFKKRLEDSEINQAYNNYTISSGYNLSKVKSSLQSHTDTGAIKSIGNYPFKQNDLVFNEDSNLSFSGETITFDLLNKDIPNLYIFLPTFEPKTAAIKFKCDDFDVDGYIPEDVSFYYYEKYDNSKFNSSGWDKIKLKPKNKKPGEISNLTITGWSTKISGQDIKIFDKDFMPTEEAMSEGFIYREGNIFYFTPNLEISTDIYLSPMVEYNGFISVYDSGWNEAVKVYVSDGTYGWHEVPLNYLDSGS